MAKRKKKSTRRRRSRMSGVGRDTLNTVIGLAGGAIGARMVQKMIPGNGKVISGVQILLGGMIANKSRDGLMRGAGYGLMATGVTDLMTQMRMLSGVDDDSYTALVPMAGVIEDPISGFDESEMGLSGADDWSNFDSIQGPGEDGHIMDPISGPGGGDPEMIVDDLDESVVGLNY